MSFEVCIVDDEVGIGEMCRDYLSGEFSVKVFTAPEEAVAAFDHDYRPDVLLTDIKMPGMNGFQMAHKIHEKSPAVPIVMMSAYADKQHLLEAFSTDALGFIEKPFSPKNMKAALDKAIRKSQQVHDAEELLNRYEALTQTLIELNARYVKRYAAAENRLIELAPKEHPERRAAAEFLSELRAENRLNSAVDRLLNEIKELRKPHLD